MALQGYEDYLKLEKEGYEVTKIIERPQGGAKFMMTNPKTGAKKIIVMNTRDREKLQMRDSVIFTKKRGS